MVVNWAELPELLKVEEVVKILRLSRPKVYENVRTGLIPSVRISAHGIRIPKARLREMCGL